MWLLLIISLPYFILFLFLWISLRKSRSLGYGVIKKDRPVSSPEKNITISVVIAAHNEADNLPSLLADIAKVNYPVGLLEVIIVDDNSSDSTYELLETATSDMVVLKVLKSKGQGKKEALITAYRVARGELIITTDADCRIHSDWLNKFAELYQENKCDMIIGPVRLFERKGLMNMIFQLEYLSLQAVTAASAAAGRAVLCSGANLGFKSDLTNDWEKAINSDILSGDDMFLLQYSKKSGKKICYLDCADTVVKTHGPDNFGSFLRQRTRWASKNTLFNDTDIVITGLITLLTNALMVVVMILAVLHPAILPQLIALFIIKSIPDLLLLSEFDFRREKRKLLLLFFPLQIIYPIYVVLTTFAGLFQRQKW